MDQKVVLPKFNVPGLRPHWMTRALWGVGALVIAQAAVLGVVLVKRNGTPEAAAAVPAALSAPLATPPATAAGAQTAARAQAAPEATPAPAAAAPASASPATAEVNAPLAPRGRGFHHRGVAKHARRGGGRAVAAAGATRKPTGKSADELDDLLKRFK
jgi:hypothetical protein